MRDPIVYSIPAFMLFMALEWWIARLKGMKVYRLHDTISDLGCGITNRIMTSLITAPLLIGYEFFYSRFGVTSFPSNSVMTWIAAFIITDFIYYWWHRISHRVNFMWAVHVVHHQSEDYNLAVALRQALLSPVTYFPFYITMAFMGFPTLVTFTCVALNTVYQFWIHTELVKTIGPLEWILNTPAHHRVHHGINRRYLDTNYAGVFIIWDRLFGTFVPETEKAVFGIVEPLRNWNPLWANFDHWKKMWVKAKSYPELKNKIFAFIKGPEWIPNGNLLPPPGLPKQIKFETHGASPYLLFLGLLICLAATYAYLWYFTEMTLMTRLILAGLLSFFIYTLARATNKKLTSR